jgi:uncharacterized protein
MTLKEALQRDLTTAIKARNELDAATIRMVLTAITNEEVSGKTSRVLTDEELVGVLTREAKKRREASDAFDKGDRPERAQRERDELVVIERYLPDQLTGEELSSLISAAIAEVGADSPSQMGLVMKSLQPRIAGRADGAAVAAAVRAALGA